MINLLFIKKNITNFIIILFTSLLQLVFKVLNILPKEGFRVRAEMPIR